MKISIKILIAVYTMLLIHPHLHSQWTQQTSGTTQTIESLEVFSANAVYAVGSSGAFLKTENGGTNWVTVTVPTSIGFSCMHFFDANTGYIAGDGGGAFKTTNAGVNWTNVSVNPATSSALSIFFTSAATGYMGNVNGQMRKTTNGGVNWTAITSGSSLDINKIFFINANTGWFGSGNITSTSGCLIRKTTNAGVDWTTQLTHNRFIVSFYFLDVSTGYATSIGQIFKTTNGGTNWIGLNPGTTGAIRSIVAGGTPSILFACGVNGSIIKSTNSGANWGELTSGSTNLLREIEFNEGSNLLGWAVGNGGTILKTTNGGGNFTAITPISAEIPDKFSLSQNYPNPFNPSTTINFNIMQSGAVQIKVFDMLGKERVTLVNQNLSAGTYKTEFDAATLPSGTYFYRLTAGEYTETRKMVLIK
jgi:photosystem II stability/assembly factor-like uncharacterized protein